MNSADGAELLFLPLGGTGEIGMNLNLYGLGRWDGRHEDVDWLMVDFGITFADGWPPGTDVILPDPAFIEKRRDRLLGLVLTHAHEDHLGAVPYLWQRLGCPIYATPFTRAFLARKLADNGIVNEVPVHEVPLGGRFDIGPFDLELITLTHSIPEPNAVAIRTSAGTVLHTGDWKLDPDPVVGEASDEAALSALGDEGVLAIVCDSTNALAEGHSGSEAALKENLTDLIGACEGRVAVGCFATNVARLQTISEAARANGRDVALVGRSLWRVQAAARETGYLADVPAFVPAEDAGAIPDDKLVLICTGSQGESRAALSRIAQGDHPHVTLGAGDTVIFSSKIIPGNEVTIGRLHNDLVALGVKVIDENDALVHVSGHPNREELVAMYQHVRPAISVPVHGERRHLEAHAALARTCQVNKALVIENGALVRLGPGEADDASVIDHVPSGRLAWDGNRAIPIDGEMIRVRTRALFHGSAVVTIALDGKRGLAGEPQVTTAGVLEDDETEGVIGRIRDAVWRTIDGLGAKALGDDAAVREAVRIAVRRSFRDQLDKRPVTTVHLVRI